MLNKYLVPIGALSFTLLPSASFANEYPRICKSPYYVCVQVEPGKVVAVPRHHIRKFEPIKRTVSYHEYNEHDERDEPNSSHLLLPQKISSGNIIKVDLGNLTWGAYDDGGNLIKSGHVSGGKSYCPDIGRSCKTVTGTYTIYSKRGESCKSTRFPVGRGGAPMPYCMFFHGGYALHGSNSVPNYNASHGCVRMSPLDAQWLNENFVEVGRTRVNVRY